MDIEINSIKFHLDKYSEILDLLNQLTDTPKYDRYYFENIVNSLEDNHFIYLCLIENKVIGIITLIIEKKLIHHGKCVGHIEDLVIDKNYRNKGIARKLLNFVIIKSRENNCYKIILDCAEEYIKFYEKLNFKKTAHQMRYDF